MARNIIRFQRSPVVPSPDWVERLISSAPQVVPLRKEIRSAVLAAGLLVSGMLGTFGVWSATAPIASAVVANGVVTPESVRQSVSHLEGGIVQRILVKEGDYVTAGQELVALEELQADSDLSLYRRRMANLTAQSMRLTFETTSTEGAVFTPNLEAVNDPDLRDALRQERDFWLARRKTDETRRQVLMQRLAQTQFQIEGFTRQLAAIRRQRELLTDDIDVAGQMVKKGYETRQRLRTLQRSEADRNGAEGDMVAQIGRAQEAISESEFQLAGIDQQRREEAGKSLVEVRSQLTELRETLRKYRDRLDRTVVRAPVSGNVINLKTRTVGAALRAGDPILDIVPKDEPLVINARVSPRDMDELHVGMAAHVVFPSFPQRNLARIFGRVAKVGADAIQDQQGQLSYFLIQVEVDRENLRKIAPQITMIPGLPAEAFIATGERTVLEYLVQPLQETLMRTFREK